MPITARLLVGTVLSVSVASAAPPRARVEVGAELQFSKPLTIAATTLNDAVAAQSDPLSSLSKIHLYVQGGRLTPPSEVKLATPYCRIDVDVHRLVADGAAPDGSDKIAITGSEVILLREPVRGNPGDYADRTNLTEAKGSHLSVESKWPATSSGAPPTSASLELHFADKPHNALAMVLCVKKGADAPAASDLERAFGALAKVAPPRVSGEAGPSEEEKRAAAAQARSVGQNRPELASEHEQAAGDRLKAAEREVAERKRKRKEEEDRLKAEQPHDLDDAVTAPASAPDATTQKAGTGDGLDWITDDKTPKGAAAPTKKRSKRVKRAQ